MGSADLRMRLSLMEPGTEVSLSVVHEGELVERQIDLAARPGAEVPEDEEGTDVESIPALEGVSLSAVEAGAGRDGTQPGVLVERVDPSCAAAAAGLQPGDVIVGANAQEVSTPKGISEAAASAPNSPLLLRVFRQGNALCVAIG